MAAEEPQTLDEWQAAADGADFLLLLDSARQYGLVEGGPEANVARCVEILERAAAQGIFPSPLDRRRAWVSRWLLAEREALGVTYRAIAVRAGLHPVAMSLIARGKRDIDRELWERLKASIEAIRKERNAT